MTPAQRAAPFHDPVRFSQEILQRKLWQRQKEMAHAVANHGVVAVKGCHASGKTYVASGLPLWWLTKHKQALVITMAPTLRQVKLMWGEIALARSGSRISFPEPSRVGLKIAEDRYAMGVSSSAGVNVQGPHNANVLIIKDEAPGIAAEINDAIEGMRAGGNVRVLNLGNPVVPSGEFFESFRANRGDVKTISISAFDTPNLIGCTIEQILEMNDEQLEYCPYPFLVRRRWVKEMYYKWGPNNPRFKSRVLGEFPSQSQWAVFSLEWIERAKREPTEAELEHSRGCLIQVGVDVAAGGDDETAACARVNGIIIARASWPDADPRGHLARWISHLQQPHVFNGKVCQWQLGPVVVDTVGVGHGIALHLADMFDVRSFKAGAVAMDSEQFLNAKAESYFRLRDMYKAQYVSQFPEALDEDTWAQLCAIEYKELSRGQIQIEPKEDARKRGVPSPDRAEAEVMAFCRVVPREMIIDATDRQVISPV